MYKVSCGIKNDFVTAQSGRWAFSGPATTPAASFWWIMPIKMSSSWESNTIFSLVLIYQCCFSWQDNLIISGPEWHFWLKRKMYFDYLLCFSLLRSSPVTSIDLFCMYWSIENKQRWQLKEINKKPINKTIKKKKTIFENESCLCSLPQILQQTILLDNTR